MYVEIDRKSLLSGDWLSRIDGDFYVRMGYSRDESLVICKDLHKEKVLYRPGNRSL